MKTFFLFFLIAAVACTPTPDETEGQAIQVTPVTNVVAVQSTAQEQKPEGKLVIDGPANIRSRAGGEKIRQLPDKYPVDLDRIEGKWARISYSWEGAAETGWTHLQNLPEPAVLINPTPITEAPKAYLEINHETIEGDESFKGLTIAIKNEAPRRIRELLYAEIDPMDTYQPIRYGLIYTGNAEWPFLVYFSGQAGDMASVPGKLVLFHPENHAHPTLNLEEGNRISSDFIGIEGHTFTFKEGYYCRIPVKTTFAITPNGCIRKSGSFYEQNEFPVPGTEDESKDFITATTLEKDLVLFQSTAKNIDDSAVIPMGTRITVKLIEADFPAGVVKVKVNDTTGWILMDTLKEIGLINSMYGGQCGVG